MATTGNNINVRYANMRDSLIRSMDKEYVEAIYNHISLNKKVTGLGFLSTDMVRMAKIKSVIKKNTPNKRGLFAAIMDLITKNSFTIKDICYLSDNKPVIIFTTLIESIHECVELGMFDESEMAIVQNLLLVSLFCIEDIHMTAEMEK